MKKEIRKKIKNIINKIERIMYGLKTENDHFWNLRSKGIPKILVIKGVLVILIF